MKEAETMSDTVIDEDVVKRLITVIDASLVSGMGEPIPGQMCVEAAVCYALDMPHSDDPGCVAKSIRALKIALNDKNWGDNKSRAKGLKRLAIAQLGTKGFINDVTFAKAVARMTIKDILPIALKAAGLKDEAELCERKPTKESVYKIIKLVYFGIYEVKSAANNAFNAACFTYGNDVSDSAYYSACSAYDIAYVHAYYNSYGAKDNQNKKTSILSLFAEKIVEILIEMDAPGCKWLYLAPKEQ